MTQPTASPSPGPPPELKTAYDWNDDPRTMIQVHSWSDFGNSAHRQGLAITRDALIPWEEFRLARSGPGAVVTVRLRSGVTWPEALRLELETH